MGSFFSSFEHTYIRRKLSLTSYIDSIQSNRVIRLRVCCWTLRNSCCGETFVHSYSLPECGGASDTNKSVASTIYYKVTWILRQNI